MTGAYQIIDYVSRIVARFHPHRVVLFGSYAYGAPTEDSDVDLLITRTRWPTSPLTAAGRMRIELGVPFPMDLIARTEADVARRGAGGDVFVEEIIGEGITLYAADDPRVGSRGGVRLRRSL